MPTNTLVISAPTQDIASRRIFRLALGTALSLVFSQAINWPMSFIAPIFTMFILALPLPAPSFKGGGKFVLALVLSVYGGMVLLPFFENAPAAGILLLILALFGCFYYTAHGGSMILGMFMTLGLTFVVTIGSVSIDALLAIAGGITIGTIFGIAFVWIAHAILPEYPRDPTIASKQSNQPAVVKPSTARRSAFRALIIVLPLAIFFLFSSSSISYVVVMIKVASMGQQASSDVNRAMGRSLLESTVWGGLGAIIGWQIMSVMPSLLMYGLVIALAGLVFGARIFQGAGMHPKASMWSYAFLTMLIILAPALLDGMGGSNAGASFYSRLFLFVLIAIYGTVSVAVFDAFWPQKDSQK